MNDINIVNMGRKDDGEYHLLLTHTIILRNFNLNEIIEIMTKR